MTCSLDCPIIIEKRIHHLEPLEEIRQEEVEFQFRQTLSRTLPLSHGEGHQFGIGFVASISIQETIRIEFIGFGEHLKLSVEFFLVTQTFSS